MALVIQLVDRMCNDCFKLKHLFLLSLDLVDILVKNVDELGSEHHVRTHINEPPCTLHARSTLSWGDIIGKIRRFSRFISRIKFGSVEGGEWSWGMFLFVDTPQ